MLFLWVQDSESKIFLNEISVYLYLKPNFKGNMKIVPNFFKTKDHYHLNCLKMKRSDIKYKK